MAPDHPREWSSEPLAELADPNVPHSFIDGDWIESPYITDSGVRLIQTGNVGTGSFKDKSNRKFVSQDSFKELGCKYVMPGDLLFCRLADPIGRSCRAPTLDGPMLTSVDVTIMRPNPKRVVTDYLVQLSNSNRWLRRAAELAGGSTRSRISRSNLGKMTVPLPPLPEQRKIAEILGSVDEAIRATEAVIEQTRKVKEGLLQVLLTKGIGHTKFKQTEIGEIPVGWEVCELGAIVEKGCIQNGLYRPSEDYGDDGTPIVRINAYDHGDEVSDAGLLRVRLGDEEERRFGLLLDDILLNRVNSLSHLAKTAIVGVVSEPMVFESNMMRIRLPKSCPLRPRFLYAVLCLASTKKYFEGRAKKAVAQCSVNQGDVAALNVAAPPRKEQEAIEEILKTVESCLKRELEILKNQTTLKQGLLQDLLTGKVRVKV